MIVTLEDLTLEMLTLQSQQKEIIKEINRTNIRLGELINEKSKNKAKLKVIMEQIEIYKQTKEG